MVPNPLSVDGSVIGPIIVFLSGCNSLEWCYVGGHGVKLIFADGEKEVAHCLSLMVSERNLLAMAMSLPPRVRATSRARRRRQLSGMFRNSAWRRSNWFDLHECAVTCDFVPGKKAIGRKTRGPRFP